MKFTKSFKPTVLNVFSLLVILIFLFLALFGSRLAPLDPLQKFSDQIKVGDKLYFPTIRPVPPGELEMFPLGTDNVGRDILSRFLWGVRPTLIVCFLVVLLRLAIGLLFGLLTGWFQEFWLTRIIHSLMNILLALPILIVALALIALSEERPLYIFILVLGGIGWADIAAFYRANTLLLKKQGFVESAVALGASNLQILRWHILPQFWSTLPTIISFELSGALLLMAELGFLGIFIGNGLIVYGADPNSSRMIAQGLTAESPELGQML
jgi:ABC-type dipeptide/oligopeptide/nickel transport system permease subunit